MINLNQSLDRQKNLILLMLRLLRMRLLVCVLLFSLLFSFFLLALSDDVRARNTRLMKSLTISSLMVVFSSINWVTTLKIFGHLCSKETFCVPHLPETLTRVHTLFVAIFFRISLTHARLTLSVVVESVTEALIAYLRHFLSFILSSSCFSKSVRLVRLFTGHFMTLKASADVVFFLTCSLVLDINLMTLTSESSSSSANCCCLLWCVEFKSNFSSSNISSMIFVSS